jgi:hypothetical protein
MTIAQRYALLIAAWEEFAFDGRDSLNPIDLLPPILAAVPEASAWDVADALRWYGENLKQEGDRLERFLGEQEGGR